MNLDFQNFSDILKGSAMVLTSLMTIFAFVKKDLVKKFFSTLGAFIKAHFTLPENISKFSDNINKMDERLQKVEYEVSPNGSGSLKDKISLIQAEIEANNWLSPEPTFRCTSAGINTFVNEAYCSLCDCTPEELSKLGWKNYIVEKDGGRSFYNGWLLSSESRSPYSSTLKLKDIKGNYKGEWRVHIRPLGPIIRSAEKEEDYLFHGTLYPHDDTAQKIADKI